VSVLIYPQTPKTNVAASGLDLFFTGLENVLRRLNLGCVVLAHSNQNVWDCARPTSICSIATSVPHKALFKVINAIIHHGGAGTAATALLSGLPQGVGTSSMPAVLIVTQ
jgi:UDP:flavonoid glycosyltransferase YjiC (YdhE family)